MKIIRRLILWTLALGFWILPWHVFVHAQGVAHSNTVTWTLSTTPGVTSQKIYRSTTSGGPYTLLATIADGTSTSFQDNAVTQGVTHYYVMTALIGTNESVFSGQASATDAGTNVNPQTGVAATSH